MVKLCQTDLLPDTVFSQENVTNLVTGEVFLSNFFAFLFFCKYNHLYSHTHTYTQCLCCMETLTAMAKWVQLSNFDYVHTCGQGKQVNTRGKELTKEVITAHVGADADTYNGLSPCSKHNETYAHINGFT